MIKGQKKRVALYTLLALVAVVAISLIVFWPRKQAYLNGVRFPENANQVIREHIKQRDALLKKEIVTRQKSLKPTDLERQEVKIYHNEYLFSEVKVRDPKPKPTDRYADLRTLNLTTPCRTEQRFGDCYVFAAVAAMESNLLLRNRQSNPDLSEEHLLGCNGDGAGGGWWHNVYKYAKNNGVIDEQTLPYDGPIETCRLYPSPIYKVRDFNFIAGDKDTIPTHQQIIDAICKHGAVVCGIYDSDDLHNYSNFMVPFKSSATEKMHAVTIVGWDLARNAWLVKNTWGPDWGPMKGYFWADFKASKIGFGAMWVEMDLP